MTASVSLDKLQGAVRKIIAETPTMPVAVIDMTPNEYALFEQLARMCGMMKFLDTALADFAREQPRPAPEPDQDEKDWARCMNAYGPPLNRCAGGRLKVKGYVCPHCNSSSPETDCKKPAKETA